MLSFFIKYFFIIYCSVHSYFKILNISDKNNKQCIINLFLSFSISFVMTLSTPMQTYSFKTLLLFVFFFVSIKIYSKIKLNIALVSSIISFSISYIALTISGFISSLLIIPFQRKISTVPTIFYVMLSSLISLLLIIALFHIKRLQKGMPFIYNSTIANFGSLNCIFIIFLFVYLRILNPILFPNIALALLAILLLAIALLIWWRRKITQSYVEKLRVSEVEALYKEISDKEHEIEKLHSNNRYLARIIHKDNKLIPAMELAVRNYLQTGMHMNPEDAKQYGADLLAQLQTMSAEREGVIQNYHEDYRFRPQIGLYSVDAIIYYMERRAIPLSIRYEYQFDKGLKEVMLSYIDENDAIHLLSDAIENAIIATMHAIKKEIKIHIGFIQDILFMDISDTGLPFEPETYQNFGLLQHTTHKDSGGSGVGLLDIWNLKQKYKISLQIYEYPPENCEYTKKIRFLFDRRNHFLIQSYRSHEITAHITRNDLHVFPYVEGSDFILTLDEENNEIEE